MTEIPDLHVSQNLTEQQYHALKKQWLIQHNCWDFNIDAPAAVCDVWRDENRNFIVRYSGGYRVRLAPHS